MRAAVMLEAAAGDRITGDSPPAADEVLSGLAFTDLCPSDLHDMEGIFPITTPSALGRGPHRPSSLGNARLCGKIRPQSSVTVTSPICERSTTARSARPISRWISCVRPDRLPRAASRSSRVCVARGSMPYSAVTQPWPELRMNGGTRPSTLAAQSTSVLPMRIRHDPSAWREKPGVSEIGRKTSAARPDGAHE